MGKTTMKILDSIYQISIETGENPINILEKVCKKCGITPPENVSLKVKSLNNLGEIKIGYDLYFEIKKIVILENNKIYLFKYLFNEKYKDVYGQYVKEGGKEYIKLNNDEYTVYTNKFKAIGELIKIHKGIE